MLSMCLAAGLTPQPMQCRWEPQALASSLASSAGTGSSGGSSGRAAATAAHAAAAVVAPAWLLRCYCAAVARHRRLAAADAAASATAAAYSRGKARPAAHAAGAGPRDALGGAGSCEALQDAEFNAMAALAGLMLTAAAAATDAAPGAAPAACAPGADGAGTTRPSKKRKVEAGAAASGAAADAATAAGAPQRRAGGLEPAALLGLSALLAAGKDLGVYVPTRDVTGAHRAVLSAIADTVIQHNCAGLGVAGAAPEDAQQQQQQPGLSPLASSAVLCALMDLDHRAVAEHLASLWGLLWATSAGHGGAPGGVGVAAAAAVAQGMVRAFSELRQLVPLLESWSAAARACGRSSTLAGCAAAVLRRPEVLEVLRSAVDAAPSGKAGCFRRTGLGRGACMCHDPPCLSVYDCPAQGTHACMGHSSPLYCLYSRSLRPDAGQGANPFMSGI
jgi:hypothetical protein